MLPSLVHAHMQINDCTHPKIGLKLLKMHFPGLNNGLADFRVVRDILVFEVCAEKEDEISELPAFDDFDRLIVSNNKID